MDYQTLFTILFIVVQLFALVWILWQVAQHTQNTARWLISLGLIGWFASSLVLATTVINGFTASFWVISFAMSTPIVVGLLLLWRNPAFQHLMRQLPLSALMGVQIYRVVGIVFLFAYLNGDMPIFLGVVTALYDVAIGLTALIVARYANQRRTIARVWNVLGILDFVYAVSITTLASPVFVQLIYPPETIEMMGQLPFSLIAIWALPLSILLHSVSLWKLAQD